MQTQLSLMVMSTTVPIIYIYMYTLPLALGTRMDNSISTWSRTQCLGLDCRAQHQRVAACKLHLDALNFG